MFKISQRFTPLGCKDIGIRIFEFVAKLNLFALSAYRLIRILPNILKYLNQSLKGNPKDQDQVKIYQ